MAETTMTLVIPAMEEYTLVARMAVSGVGALMGLDIDQIGDLRTAVDEACDCLLHQPRKAEQLELAATRQDGRLSMSVRGIFGQTAQQMPPSDLEITRGILETLMPQVELCGGSGGICRISFSMPV